MAQSSHRTVRTTLMVTLVIFASKAFGFIRDVISAGYFATGMERDAYASAYSLFYLPVLLFNSCITSTIVPLYINTRDKNGLRAANSFASNCMNLFGIAGFGIGLLMLILARPLVGIVYGGFASVPGKLDLTARMTQVMMPSLPFVAISIVMASLLNANERYVAAQLTGFPLTIAVIVATVAFAPRFGIVAVAWGVFASGILQMLILVPSTSNAIHYSLRVRPRDPRIQRMLLLALPAILSMAVNELNHMIDKSIASFLNNGDISAMDYAYRLITFATGVLAVPLTTIMFSRLSQQAARDDRRGIAEILSQSIEVLTLILLPVTVVGSVLSYDVIRLAYMHGKFGADAAAVTSGVFLYYLVGIWGFSLRDVLNRAFHALQDTKTPMLIACVSVVLNVVLNLTLSQFMGVNGLALATSISCAIGALILFLLLKRKLGRKFGLRGTTDQLLRITLAACISTVVAVALNHFVPEADGKLIVFLRLLLVSGFAFAAFFLSAALLRVRQLAFLKNLLHRRG